VLPTDTMRNTVYALAAEGPLGALEEFGARIADRLLGSGPEVAAVEVALEERPWRRLEVGGAPHPHAFAAESERRTATVHRGREAGWTEAGLADLLVLKTAGSAFSGFRRDGWTTLRDTEDRILATRVAARWRHLAVTSGASGTTGAAAGAGGLDFDASFAAARRVLLETFATHRSRSVQHTLHAMGEAVLAARPEIAEIHLSLPNVHHIPFDLVPLGLPDRNEVFVATTEPYGLIEATVRRRE
jgi:urate oxidase